MRFMSLKSKPFLRKVAYYNAKESGCHLGWSGPEMKAIYQYFKEDCIYPQIDENNNKIPIELYLAAYF